MVARNSVAELGVSYPVLPLSGRTRDSSMLLPHATMGLTPTYGKVVHWSRTWQQVHARACRSCSFALLHLPWSCVDEYVMAISSATVQGNSAVAGKYPAPLTAQQHTWWSLCGQEDNTEPTVLFQEFEERQQLRLQLEEEDDLATTAPVELQVQRTHCCS